MQTSWFNGVVTKRPQANIKIPAEFQAVVNEYMPLAVANRKWMVYAAGLLALLQLSAEEREGLFRKLRAENFPGAAYADLIGRARARGNGEPRIVVTEPIMPPANGERPSAESAGSHGPKPGVAGPRGRRR
jgi:hypothetical protein